MLPYSAFNLKKTLDKNGAPLRVYGTCGDAHLQHLVLHALLDHLLEPDARDFNMDALDGESATISDVMALCGNMPFLAERRVVVVSRAERLEGLHRGSGESDDDKSKAKQSPAKRLSEAIKNVPPMTVLILQRTPETPDIGASKSSTRCLNAAVDKTFDDGKHGLIIDCTIDAKNSGMVTAIVENEAARRKVLLERGVASHLVERVGVDIAHLLNELEKCGLRAGDGQAVTNRIIDEMTQRAPHDKVFDLMDVVASRNGARAVAMLRELVGNGQAPEAILAILIGQLRKLLVARFLMDQNLPVDPNAVSRLSPSLLAQMPSDSKNLPPAFPFLARQLANQARTFSSSQINAALEASFAVDLAVKGIEGDGGTEPRDQAAFALELFVAQLCARDNSAPHASSNAVRATASSTRIAR